MASHEVGAAADQMFALSDSFTKASTQVQDAVARIEGAAATPGWQGQAKESFVAAWAAYKTDLAKLSELLAESSADIKQRQQAFEQADQSSSTFGS